MNGYQLHMKISLSIVTSFSYSGIWTNLVLVSVKCLPIDVQLCKSYHHKDICVVCKNVQLYLILNGEALRCNRNLDL